MSGMCLHWTFDDWKYLSPNHSRIEFWPLIFYRFEIIWRNFLPNTLREYLIVYLNSLEGCIFAFHLIDISAIVIKLILQHVFSVRFVHSWCVFPRVNIDNFSLLLFIFYCALEIEERPLQTAIDDIHNWFYCKKFRKVHLFQCADRTKYVFSSLDSLQQFFQIDITPIYLKIYVQQLLTFLTVFFVLFLKLIVHVFVLFHNLFD